MSAQNARTPFSDDPHATAGQSGWSSKRLAVTALLCALAFVLTFVEIPIFPPAPYLTYDPSGIVCFLATFIYGPATGALVIILPWMLKTLFTFNIYGHLMAVLANISLILPAVMLADKLKGGARGIMAGMLFGTLISVLVCIVGNILITPLYTATTHAQVIALILPVLLPFNLLKIVINCIVTAAVKTPVSKVLTR